MRTVALASVFLIAALPVLSQAKPVSSEPVSIPFTTSDGMITVAATLGGTIPIHVIVDTGAGLDILAPSLIEKVHGKPAGQFTGFRMTGERLDIPLFVVPELSVGPLLRKDTVVGSFDVLDKLHLDGIVSVNDFRQQPFTIDFVKKAIVFETPTTLAHRRAAGKSLPLQLDDQRGITIDLFAQFLIAGQPGQCEIDTGSQNASVSLRYMTLLGIEKDAAGVRKQEAQTVAGGTEVRYKTTLPQISLAAAPEISLAPASVSFSDIIYDCVVRTDYWSGRMLTIDIANRQLIVSVGPPAH